MLAALALVIFGAIECPPSRYLTSLWLRRETFVPSRPFPAASTLNPDLGPTVPHHPHPNPCPLRPSTCSSSVPVFTSAPPRAGEGEGRHVRALVAYATRTQSISGGEGDEGGAFRRP